MTFSTKYNQHNIHTERRIFIVMLSVTVVNVMQGFLMGTVIMLCVVMLSVAANPLFIPWWHLQHRQTAWEQPESSYLAPKFERKPNPHLFLCSSNWKWCPRTLADWEMPYWNNVFAKKGFFLFALFSGWKQDSNQSTVCLNVLIWVIEW